MEQKQRLFIYDRKEIMILVILGLTVTAFAFTLGVHLGKRVGPKNVATHPGDAVPAETMPDQIPNRQELVEQAKGIPQAIDESLNQALHDEVAKTGIKLDTPRQVELPENARSKTGGATTLTPPTPTLHKPEHKAEHKADSAHGKPSAPHPTAHKAPAPHKLVHGFTLQVGSHSTMEDAKKQIGNLEALGKKAFYREANIEGKGKWYRVYLGDFPSRAAAEKAGDSEKSQHSIDSYIITQLSE